MIHIGDNAGYYWETHEALEGIWRTFDRSAETALFLQGLIQLSVAHSHAYHRGRPDLGIKLAGWALERWAGVEQEVYGGIDLGQLRMTTVQWRLDPMLGAIGWRLVI